MQILLFSVLILAAIGAAIALDAKYVEPNWIRIRKIRIDSKGKIKSSKPLRITLLSDFHYPKWTNHRFVRDAIEMSNRFQPDLVFFLGDFFDKNKRTAPVLPSDIDAAFGGVQSYLGAFGVLGNHDHWFDKKSIQQALETQTNVQLIDNRSIGLESVQSNLYIVGIGDLWSGDAHYEAATKGLPADAVVLLLSHNPDVVEDINDPRILIQFSGHTHGGQIRLPFVGALRVPSNFGNRYSKGFSDRGNHRLYVNCGVCSMKRIRFLCPPEVTWVEIV